MNTLPIRTDGMDFTYLATVPKLDDKGNQTRNADGVPKHEVQLLCASAQARRPEVLAVVIATTNPPDLAPMTPVLVEGLVARHWQQGDRGGIAFSCELIRPSGKGNRPAAPVLNGTKPPEPAAV